MNIHEYDYFLNPRIPLSVVVGILLLFIGMVFLILIKCKVDKVRFIGVAGFLCYLVIIICNTLIYRTPMKSPRVEFIPFWGYVEYFNGGKPSYLVTDLLNLCLFIPIGALLVLSMKRSRWYKAAGIAFVISFFIEFFQYSTGRGWFETDDIIHNTIGCLIGYGFVLMIMNLNKKDCRK